MVAGFSDISDVLVMGKEYSMGGILGVSSVEK